MKTWRNVLTILFVLALLLSPSALPVAAEWTQPINLVNQVPDAVAKTAEHIAARLEEQGFDVLSGYLKLYTEEDCDYSFDVMETCYGNNPAAPYILPVLPYWPDEYQDPASKNAFGPTRDGYSVNYRLDPREAILIMGVLPPQAAYMGLQTYLGDRTGAIVTDNPTYVYIRDHLPPLLSTLFNTVPGDHSRVQLAASLSNSINNVVIERESGAAWDKLRFFIITPDQYMNQAIRDNLSKSSLSLNDVFTEPIPGTMRLGLSQTNDSFLTLMRYAMPNSESEAAAWRETLPLVVLRIRDTDPNRQPQKYGAISLETRVAESEKYLGTTVNNLATAILGRWHQPCPDGNCTGIVMPFLNWQPAPINLTGPLCESNWMNCLGDTQDTVYQVAPSVPLDSGEIYAIAGPLGTETGNATYVGLGLNSQRLKKGFENLSDFQLSGTAGLFASETVTSTNKLFVYYFSRSCAGLEALTEGNCLEVRTEAFTGCPNGEGSDDCDHLAFSVRDYIKPGTQRGADAALTVPPKIIKLHRPSSGTFKHRLYLPVLAQ